LLWFRISYNTTIFVVNIYDMSIATNLHEIKLTIPSGIKLVAVSKTKPIELIKQVYEAGQSVFGENRPLELKEKFEVLPKDIEWHFIGHPQSKQVKYFAPFVSLIHGVDGLKLLQIIDKEGAKNNRIINCLLQFHIAQEETKFGLTIKEAQELISSSEFKELKNVNISGVMGMATYTDDLQQVRNEFKNLTHIFHTLKQSHFSSNSAFKEISMGMSGDYQIAIEEGSTMVRIGSSIFGERL
jgi:pyridoxal phosphate enzyme (YggS family)